MGWGFREVGKTEGRGGKKSVEMWSKNQLKRREGNLLFSIFLVLFYWWGMELGGKVELNYWPPFLAIFTIKTCVVSVSVCWLWLISEALSKVVSERKAHFGLVPKFREKGWRVLSLTGRILVCCLLPTFFKLAFSKTNC